MSQYHSVRRSYDTVAEEYANKFRDELAGKLKGKTLTEKEVNDAQELVRKKLVTELSCTFRE